jgi:membrane protein
MSTSPQLPEHASLLRKAREVTGFAYRRGSEVNLPQVAASLTFTTMLSLVPLVAVALALFTAFPFFADFRGAIENFVLKSLPGQISDTVLRYVNEFASKATRLTAFGLIFLGFTALSMIMTVDRVLNDIWRVRNRRPLGQRILIYWAIITLGPILIGASLTASSYLWTQSADAIKQLPRGLRSVLDYAPLVLSGFAYAALYVFVPNRRVRWRHALLGGFIAAILAEMLKNLFGLFIGRGSVGSIYGAFAALPLFFLWLFLSWYVLLFGAAIAATLPRLTATRFVDERRAGDAFVTATALLKILLDARMSNHAVQSGAELAARVRSDRVDTDRLLEILERLGYVRQLANSSRGRGGDIEWMLTCDQAVMPLRPAFQRFAVDPANTLLTIDALGLGAPINQWIDEDAWLNAPLEQSLASKPSVAAGRA